MAPCLHCLEARQRMLGLIQPSGLLRIVCSHGTVIVRSKEWVVEECAANPRLVGRRVYMGRKELIDMSTGAAVLGSVINHEWVK